jgi:hypothetical protein
MKKAVRDFSLTFNQKGIFKLWAFLAFGIGLAMAAMGVFGLAICYGGKPSLVDAWVMTILGLVFYILSGFGFKFPKSKKEVRRRVKSH